MPKANRVRAYPCRLPGDIFNKTVYGYTGTYVNVGQIDNGVPYTNTTANIAYRNETGLDAYTPHATRVAEIIGGDYGYAPNCRIFSYKSMNESSFYLDVEALIARSGNDTIHIINVSMNYDSLYTEGTYSEISSWVDHITEEYEVIFTIMSGNGDQSMEKVRIAGMAYNAITVGNLDDKESLIQTDHRICNLIENGDYKQSLYLENDNLAEKPDIVAPGTGIDIVNMSLDDENTGTSFAAPQVAGTLAQLMYASNNLKYRPSLSKALINVSGKDKLPGTSYTSTAIHRYSDRDGAGTLSAKNAAWVLASGRYTYYLGGTSTFPKTITFNVSASDSIIRVALSWEKRAAADLLNLNLSVTAPNGTFYSSSQTNNVEVVEILPSLYGTGTYTITITRLSGSGTEWLSVAWY